MTERPRRSAEEIEEETASQIALHEQKPSEGDQAGPGHRPASLLDMLFREAEVIARNLKESGTRR